MLNVTVRLIGWRLVVGEGPSWGSKPPCGPPKATQGEGGGWVGAVVPGAGRSQVGGTKPLGFFNKREYWRIETNRLEAILSPKICYKPDQPTDQLFLFFFPMSHFSWFSTTSFQINLFSNMRSKLFGIQDVFCLYLFTSYLRPDPITKQLYTLH